MKGVDYTKQLAKDREYFQDANRKLKEATDKRIADVEARSEHVQKKQADSHMADLDRAEKNHQKAIDRMKEDTQVSIGDKVQRLNKKHEEEISNFQRESNAKSQDFNQRLNDIKSSYQKSFDSERTTHENVQEANQKRYMGNVTDIKNKTDAQLKEYQERMLGAGADLKQQNKQEREQLVRAHEKSMNELRKDEITKQDNLKERLSTDLRKTKEVHEAEKEHLRDFTQEQLKANHQAYEGRFQKMTDDYAENNERLREAQAKENLRQNRESQDRVVELQRVYDKQLRSADLEKKRLNGNGSSDLEKIHQQQQGLKENDILKNKITKLQTAVKDNQRAHQLHSEDAQNKFNDELKIQSSEATARLEKKSNELAADKIVTVAKERENASKLVKSQQEVTKLEKINHEQQLMLEKNSAEARINNLKENFNKNMTALEEKLKVGLEEASKVANQDKADFVAKQTEQRSKEIFDMRQSFSKMMDQTVLGYEQRISSLERENSNLKMTMDQKVKAIMDQSDKKIETQRKHYEASRNAEAKSQQIANDQREAKIRADLNSAISIYQKKLDKMASDHETKLKLLTSDYENKLREAQSSKNALVAEKDMAHSNEVLNLKSAFEQEKKLLVSKYEEQIETAKVGHEKELANMKNFKQIS